VRAPNFVELRSLTLNHEIIVIARVDVQGHSDFLREERIEQSGIVKGLPHLRIEMIERPVW
jgi:hypothetical protein